MPLYSCQLRCCSSYRSPRSNHEEADTWLLLHAHQTARVFSSVSIKNPDRDVMVLSLAKSKDFHGCLLLFMTGSSSNNRIINITELVMAVGPPDGWLCSSQTHPLPNRNKHTIYSTVPKLPQNSWPRICGHTSWIWGNCCLSGEEITDKNPIIIIIVAVSCIPQGTLHLWYYFTATLHASCCNARYVG